MNSELIITTVEGLSLMLCVHNIASCHNASGQFPPPIAQKVKRWIIHPHAAIYRAIYHHTQYFAQNIC